MLEHGQVRYGPSGWEVWDDPMEFWLSEELLAERAPKLLKALRDAKEMGPKLHQWRLDAQEQHLKDIPVQDLPEKPYRVIRVYDDCLTDMHGMPLTIEQLATLSECADSLVTMRKRFDLLGAAFDPAKSVGMIGPRGPKWV